MSVRLDTHGAVVAARSGAGDRAIDFAYAEQGGIPGECVARQPDLRVPIAKKLARLGELLDPLAAGGTSRPWPRSRSTFSAPSERP